MANGPSVSPQRLNHVKEARERNPNTIDSALADLAQRRIGNLRKHFANIVTVLALAVSGNAMANDTLPNAPSTSADASADKGGGQVVTLKDGRRLSFAELFAEEQKTGRDVSDDIGDEDLSERYLKYSKNQKRGALNQATERTDGKKEALNQADSLISAIKEIENGALNFSTTPETIKRNKELANILYTSLNNPYITLETKTRAILKAAADHLSSGKGIAYINPRVLAELKKL